MESKMEKSVFLSGQHAQAKIEADAAAVVAASWPSPEPAVVSPEITRVDAPDDSAPPRVARADDVRTYFGEDSHLVVDQRGNPCVIVYGSGNAIVYALGGPKASAHIARHLHKEPSHRRKLKMFVAAVNDALGADALLANQRVHVWHRCAQKADGTVVIALYDDANTQVWITPGSARIVTSRSDVLFVPSANSKALPLPLLGGDYRLLKKYLNLDPFQFVLVVGYITYVIAHAKLEGNAFPVLAVFGGQGSGKGVVSKIVLLIIDPSNVGVQKLPANATDFAVAAEAQHAIAFDNLRHLNTQTSDILCMLATGGSITSRKLYTNGEPSVMFLQCAVVLNGIHPYLQEPDLAQRSIMLHLKPLLESARQSEREMMQDFYADLPSILGGLYDLIAKILMHLPNAEVTHPQRMLDFVKWLAAMELAHGAPAGAYQMVYSDMVNEGQLESIRDDILGYAVLEFSLGLKEKEWSGTPQELLDALQDYVKFGSARASRGLPETPIALSKRLAGMCAALASQGISVEFSRGKTRQINVQVKG